ncbi:S-methyl-5'-thioadenosine phosphorylase-like protein [Leptotrombidium deliense]|uniref:S-methyl-5'-thioadenosine phosphorylase n=1 Tax=Leptotrombidium deliense TaxID=299467 RepID=A0A443SWK5_9ACAR|nr:S-methyl-5'-thioadenosine phosphorylase-like protein [Leptotrombidium deliense]
MSIKIGIIGGTGLESDVNILTDVKQLKTEETPFGCPSDEYVTEGFIGEIPVIIMGRHGKDHNISPTNVNYAANLWTLKSNGCTHVLVTTACGSLKQQIAPGSLCIVDQYIDRTQGKRRNTIYTVSHIPQGLPFDRTLQVLIELLEESCAENGVEYHKRVTTVTIEGPRFSTLAESRLYQSWGCDIVNMTSVPEAQLAAEMGLVYAALALVTDYDCWHCDESESVCVELVDKRMKELKIKASKVLVSAVKKCSAINWQQIIDEKSQTAKNAIMCQ